MSTSAQDSHQRPIVLGVAGGTASGKTTVARAILDAVGAETVAYLQHDAYYRDNPHLTFDERASVNYDHPDSLETDLLVEHIRMLKGSKPVDVPVYDFMNHRRTEETNRVLASPVILVDGILVLATSELRDEMDMKIYVDTDSDVRFIRRLQRDIDERGRTLPSVVGQYLGTVRPMHLEFVEPSKRHADIIIPYGGMNTVAMGMVTSRVKELLA